MENNKKHLWQPMACVSTCVCVWKDKLESCALLFLHPRSCINKLPHPKSVRDRASAMLREGWFLLFLHSSLLQGENQKLLSSLFFQIWPWDSLASSSLSFRFLLVSCE